MISATSSLGETPGLAATRIWSSLPTFSEELLRRRQVEAGERGAADRVDRAELDEAGDRELLDRPFCLRRRSRRRPSKSFFDAVATSMTTSPRPGQAPSLERERVELAAWRRVDAEAEVRCAAEDDRLAVARRSAVPRRATPPIAACDVRQRRDLREQRLVERARCRAGAVEVEGRLAGDRRRRCPRRRSRRSRRTPCRSSR